MNRKEKSHLRRFFGEKWCPVLGWIPCFDTPAITIINDAYDVICSARALLGVMINSPFESDCPTMDEIKTGMALETQSFVDASSGKFDNKDQLKLKDWVGFSDDQILAARDLFNQYVFSLRRIEIDNKAQGYIFQYSPEYKTPKIKGKKKKRNLHAEFDDYQVLAILAISRAYASLRACIQDGADENYFRHDIKARANWFLDEAKNIHIRLSKKSTSQAFHGEKGKMHGSESQKGITERTKKERKSIETRNRIWRIMAERIREDSRKRPGQILRNWSIAKKMKKEHKIKECPTTIYNAISVKDESK